ncbi:MAG: hypothetical protein Q8P15_03555 [Nanoarchaeota archaeon]|nr:hypothetical protein [Nanoarchaeota archaeon]
MRTSLIIFGVIFLVIGALLYFVPMQEFKANTTTTEGGDVDNRTSSANITIPIGYAYASGTIGFILLILGLAIPSPNRRSNSKKGSYDKVVESKENIEVGDGNKHKIIRERSERHNSEREK